MKTITKTIFLISILMLLIIASASVVSASNENVTAAESYKITTDPVSKNLTDDNVSTYLSTDTVSVKTDADISSLYIRLWDNAASYTVTIGDKVYKNENNFLHSYFKIPSEVKDCKELTITFEEKVKVSDVFAFSDGTLPDWVHTWSTPYDRADLLLNTTHADDEQLFFAGVLPYYSCVKKYRVQVVYFTDHNKANEAIRRHELLNALWIVGIDHYPVISNFPDAYSETYNGALNNLKNAGFTEDDVYAFQTEMLRRFKPLVVVGHDLNGEYKHGQHILNAQTLTKAVEYANDPEKYPESAQKYGLWDTPKLYLHLYENNKIVMNWDEPYEELGGKTPFQMTQLGFEQHNSQHYTWFYTWLNGNNKNITAATQIYLYSPCNYGLYRSTVGEDVAKNDFFENLVNYDEQERIEQEKLEEELRKQQEAEESRRQEESSIQESIDEASRAEASKLEEQKLASQQSQNNKKMLGTVAIVILISSVVTLGVIIFKNFNS